MKEPQKSNKRPIISPLSELPARLMPLGLQVQKGQPLDDTSYKVRSLSPAGKGEEPSAQRGTKDGLGGKEAKERSQVHREELRRRGWAGKRRRDG